MITKQIIFTDACKAEVLEQEIRQPEANEVMVRLSYTAISTGTEKANYTGDSNISIVRAAGEPAVFPRRVGYSGAGIVEKVGEKVTKARAGDRVIVFWGCHSAYITIDENRVVKIMDENLSMKEAAVLFISTFPAAAIRKTHLEFGESALVMGLGILGQFAVKMLRAAGAAPIIAADPLPERRALAIESGADYAIDPTEVDFAQKVKALTHGGANVAIEVTGLGVGLNQTLDCMARLGRVALLGCTRNADFSVDYYRKVHGPGITLVGAHTKARPENDTYPGYWTEADEINGILRLLSGKRMSYANLIQEIHSPHDAQKVYTRMLTERSFPVGILFDWSKV